MSSLIDSIRKFIMTCPFLQDGRVDVDYIGEEMGYSIDPLPCDPIVQRYTDGGAKKQLNTDTFSIVGQCRAGNFSGGTGQFHFPAGTLWKFFPGQAV